MILQRMGRLASPALVRIATNRKELSAAGFFTSAQPDNSAASLRDFVSGALTSSTDGEFYGFGGPLVVFLQQPLGKPRQ